MAAFPDVPYGWRDLTETAAPVIARSEVDRGIPKQRRVQADPLITLSLTVYFDAAAEQQDFEDWFYSAEGANAGAAWFDFTHPRTGVVVQARVVGGQLGPLKHSSQTLAMSERTLQIEYVRPVPGAVEPEEPGGEE
jgi:hypothetical protein